jgi:hypothetical protein
MFFVGVLFVRHENALFSLDACCPRIRNYAHIMAIERKARMGLETVSKE